MTQLLSGIGRPVFKSLRTATPKFWWAEPLNFKLNANSAEVVSYKMLNGKKVPAGAKQISEETMLSTSIEAASWEALQIAIGLETATTASLDLYEQRIATIPATGTPEISDPDIATALGVQVTVVESGAWGKSGALQLLASGSPAAGQYRVDGTNSKLVFNSAQAGAIIAYSLIKNYTNLRTIGKEAAAAALNTLGFEGLVYSEADSQLYKLVVPRMVRTKAPSFDFGEKTVLELEYRLVVAPGETREWYLIEMPANYAP